MKKYLMNLKKITSGMNIKEGTDKVGGNPTYLPKDEDREKADDFYFLMEIYNNKYIKGKEDVLCWQIYQGGEFGGPIEEVLEIPIGAKKNINNEIQKRRWLDEYIIEYEEKEERGYDEEEEDYDSKIG